MRSNDFLYFMLAAIRTILILILLICCHGLSFSQSVELIGTVEANGDVENIHVINKSSNMFTTTNSLGAFRITAKFRDTLQFTSVRYKMASVIVSYKAIQEKSLIVYLEENINVLDEVIVGKVLTGDLDSDIENSDAERPIDFYDVGLPGYTGKPLTQSERRLAEADGGTLFTMTSINVHKLLNKISGRTKMLKERVRLERNRDLMNTIKDRLSADFFNTNPLDEAMWVEFFMFCSEDPDFEHRCQGKSDIEVFEFLKEKYIVYLINLKSRQD